MRHALILGATALTLLAAGAPAFAQDHDRDHDGHHGGGGGGRPASTPAARPAAAPQAGPAPSATPGGGFNRGQGAPGGYGGRRDSAGSGGFRERGYGVQPGAPGAGGYAGRGLAGQAAAVAPGSGGYAGGGYRQAAPGAQGFSGDAGRGRGDFGARDRGVQDRGVQDRGAQGGFSGQRFGGAGGGYDRRGGGYGGARSFSYRGRSFSAFRARPYVYPRGYGYRRYALHAFLPALFLSSTWYLNDWAAYDLGPPPSAQFRWVRYGPDALLVDSYTGEVVDTAYGVFDDGSGYGAEGAYEGGYEDGPPPYPAPRPY